MGWQAFAMIDGYTRRERPEILADFRDAYISVKNDCGTADIGLDNAWLDNSVCKQMFMQALPAVYHYSDPEDVFWSIASVKSFNEIANWDFPVTKDELPYQWSARHFIAVCARHSLSIKFIW